MNLKDRILQYIDYKDIDVAEFERKCKISNGSVSKMTDNTRTTTIDKISNAYPDLNLIWLRTGIGDMINIDVRGDNNIVTSGNNNDTTNHGGNNNTHTYNTYETNPSQCDTSSPSSNYTPATDAIIAEYQQRIILLTEQLSAAQSQIAKMQEQLSTSQDQVSNLIQLLSNKS